MAFSRGILICGIISVMLLNQFIHGMVLPEEDINVTKGPEFPLNIMQVVNDASNVFGNVVGKMIAKKRLMGLDSNNWYW